MSLTIHDCASMTAAEHRERRRQRVLQNSEKRLTALLSGPNGEYERQAPTIEGLSDENEHYHGMNDKSKDIYTPVDYIDKDQLQFVTPVYSELVDRHRFGLMVAIGMAFRIAVQLGWIEYVALAFTAIFFSWELLTAVPQLRKYPKHGYLVNMLLISGLNERLVSWIGLALDLLWEFGIDFCLMTFSFVCTHLLFTFATNIAGSQCCSGAAN